MMNGDCLMSDALIQLANFVALSIPVLMVGFGVYAALVRGAKLTDQSPDEDIASERLDGPT
jgi:hypothetical protein